MRPTEPRRDADSCHRHQERYRHPVLKLDPENGEMLDQEMHLPWTFFGECFSRKKILFFYVHVCDIDI